MKNEPIIIETHININVESTWEYYNNPEHIVNWNFASKDWCCPKAENDLKVNGKLKYRMEAKDGSFGFDFEATYDEVSKHKKIRYTIADGRQVAIDFAALNNETKITIAFEPEKMNSIDMQRQGWQAILNNFKAYAESR